METPTPSTSSARRTAVLLVAVAFVAGALIGVAGDRVMLIHQRDFFQRRGVQFMERRIVDHLGRELQLTPPQRAQVEQILQRHHQRMRQISDGIRPQMGQEIDAANREIVSILTPEQRKKFESMRMRIGPHHGRRDHAEGPPPPPGF